MGRADSELVGDIAQFTALALLVFHLTGPGLGVSGVVVAEIVPVLLLLAPLAGPLVAASLGYKTDIPYLSDGWRWSAVRVLSGRCETPVVGPGGSAISRNRPRWHRVGLTWNRQLAAVASGRRWLCRAGRGSGVLQGSGGCWCKALCRREGVGQRPQPASSLSRMRLGPSMRPLFSRLFPAVVPAS